MIKILSQVGVLALLATLGVLLVFLFPAHCGPFSVTHGPATAFRALNAACRLFAAISSAMLVAAMLGKHILSRFIAAYVPVQVSGDHLSLFALRC